MQAKQKLTVKNLSKSFNQSHLSVLKNITLSVNRGELVSVIGPSGCGKSTLLDCIAGLTVPDSGDVLLDGASIVNTRGKVSYMFQDDVMFPWRTVLDNVIIPLELNGVKKKSAQNNTKRLLTIFGLEKFALYYPFMLSGGMRERASLLRTYLCHKEVMLLDEPFSKLDALTRLDMQQWFLKVLDQKRKTVLFVTHDVDEAIYLSDRIYVFSKSPGAITAEILVDIEKSRSQKVVLSQDFIKIKRRIMDMLRQ